MSKQNHLNRWLWKWHMIAGLITLPLMVLLAITGMIYLFKADFEQSVYKNTLYVTPEAEQVSYAAMYDVASKASSAPITTLVLPSSDEQAIQFVAGRRSQKKSVYVNPYKGEVTGEIVTADTLMMTVRKLHGELLLGKAGTYTVELAASWFVVLIVTGLYVWWPAKKFSLAGFFTIRTKNGRRIFYRDLHSVTGFWLSSFMLLILAGAMPWTDVFGSQLKWVQKQTDTGYPSTWDKPGGLKSVPTKGPAFSLDQMVEVARSQALPGEITIALPRKATGVFTVSNESFWLRDQAVRHFDQYSGEVIKSHTWADVGILMNMRQVAMRLHQGEYGSISWWIVFIVSLIFTISTIAGLISYVKRKPSGEWGLPKVPEQWRVGQFVIILIIGLGVLFPLFGASLVLIYLWDVFANKQLQSKEA